jgi:small subunit ribosomal protein S16
MVRLRLRRVGSKAQPSYRIVAADKEPRTNPATIQLVEDRIYDWIGKGAQSSESVLKVFKSAGLLERYERFKKGEALETLLAEAQAAEAQRNINPKTERSAQAKKSK